MKIFKRIVCFVLATVVLLEMLAACGANSQAESEIYLTKGEFCSYYVYENSMTSQIYTLEDVENSTDGSVEAKILAEWGYLPEETATEGIKKPVTRETVVTVCANGMLGLSTGDVEAIKDRDLLENPQLMADAYASGLVDLDNGYFNGAKKMSLEDCTAIMDRARELDADFHFGEDDAVYDYADNVVDIDMSTFEGEGIEVQWIEDDSQEGETSQANGTSSINWDEEPVAQFLAYRADETESSAEANSVAQYNNYLFNSQGSGLTGFICRVPKTIYESAWGSPEKGSMVHIRNGQAFVPMSVGYYGTELLCLLTDVQQNNGFYDCYFTKPTFEEAVESANVSGVNLKEKNAPSVTKEIGEFAGWKFNVDTSGGAIKISAEKDFTVRGDEYWKNGGPRADWAVDTKTIHAKSEFTLSDFNIDVDNLRSFANKRGSGFVKVSYDSMIHFSLSTSLRFTPDSNRNGKFPSNWNNSRWTDGGSSGATEIKVARFTPTNGVVGANIYVYLKIGFDGSLEWTTSADDNGVVIRTKNGNISKESFGKKTTEVSANINVYGRFGVDAKLVIFGFINVIEYDVGLDADVVASVNLYIGEQVQQRGVFADNEGLQELRSSDDTFHYCINISGTIGVSGQLKDCAVKLVLDALSWGKSLNFSVPIWGFSFHFEDGAKVNHCTRGDQTEEDLETTDDDSIELSSYKEVLYPGTCSMVRLDAIPAETAKVIRTANSVTVTSGDTRVVIAKYDKATKTIVLEAVSEGSAEVVIKAQKGHWWWKQTVDQSISVTVSPLPEVYLA